MTRQRANFAYSDSSANMSPEQPEAINYGAPNHSIPRGGLVATPGTPPSPLRAPTEIGGYSLQGAAQLAKQDREAAQSGAVAREAAGLRAHFARKNEAYEAARRRQNARLEGRLLPTAGTEIERMREDAATRRARMQEAGANARAKIQADSAASVAKENAGGLVSAAEWNAKGAENAAKAKATAPAAGGLVAPATPAESPAPPAASQPDFGVLDDRYVRKGPGWARKDGKAMLENEQKRVSQTQNAWELYINSRRSTTDFQGDFQGVVNGSKAIFTNGNGHYQIYPVKRNESGNITGVDVGERNIFGKTKWRSPEDLGLFEDKDFNKAWMKQMGAFLQARSQWGGSVHETVSVQAASGDRSLPRASTEADFMRYPPGTRVIAPDGSIITRPYR